MDEIEKARDEVVKLENEEKKLRKQEKKVNKTPSTNPETPHPFTRTRERISSTQNRRITHPCPRPLNCRRRTVKCRAEEEHSVFLRSCQLLHQTCLNACHDLLLNPSPSQVESKVAEKEKKLKEKKEKLAKAEAGLNKVMSPALLICIGLDCIRDPEMNEVMVLTPFPLPEL